VSTFNGKGIVSMAKMKPESNNAGRKVAIMEYWVAKTCVRAAAEMNIPRLRAPARNSSVSPDSSR
jgi:hypothetical protein